MERRGRIPVAKFRTQESKTRSRSRVREPDYNEQDPETDLFTLLEDNIALKEENKALKLELEDHKKIQNDLLEDNAKMRAELDDLLKRQKDFEKEIKNLSEKQNKTINERNALDKLHKMKIDIINDLTAELQLLQSKQHTLSNAVVDTIALKSKLLKILPELSNTAGNEMESLLDVNASIATAITSDLLERLADEFLTLKSSMGAVELQLYEANEKISELIENQHHLEEENETLRSENTNLTKVAKLLTENMKESVETSKKMEAALIKLKQRNEELNIKAKDLTDGGHNAVASTPSPTTLKDNAEFNKMTEEVHSQNRDHGERIVEMKSLLDAAIAKNTNDELKTLQLRVEILENELGKALARAEHAERELEKFHSQSSAATITMTASAAPPPPPPPPPPMPSQLLYQAPGKKLASGAAFSDCIASHNLHSGMEAAGGGSGGKIISTVMQQVQAEAATGLDALVREFKSGRVTLRRNRRKTHTNDALQEMFQVLEVSQKQNRNSKICMNLHI